MALRSLAADAMSMITNNAQTIIDSPRSTRLSPPAILERIALDAGSGFVLRDDLLPGGTKQRALVPFLTEFARHGTTDFVYASPFAGFAQVALAACARMLGLRATIFCEELPHGLGGGENLLHEFSQLALNLGARVVAVSGLGQAEQEAMAYAQEKPGRAKIPLGFDHPEFHAQMRLALTQVVQDIAQHCGGTFPQKIWAPVGSGTLARVLRETLPEKIKINLIDVRVLPPSDPRIASLERDPRFSFKRAPEVFAEKAWEAPPLPSNQHYDAKLWAFFRRHGEPGDLWWNVAR